MLRRRNYTFLSGPVKKEGPIKIAGRLVVWTSKILDGIDQCGNFSVKFIVYVVYVRPDWACRQLTWIV